MTSNLCRISGVVTLAAGLLATSPAIVAQMRGGMGAQTQPGMPQSNTQPGMQNGPNGPMAMQNNPEAVFLAHMRRNSKVETDLSKLALKNSSNDEVKKLATQVISENRKNEMQMTSAAAANSNMPGPSFGEDTPAQTRKAEKQMKKLTGIPFDQMYLSQMDGYVKDDQRAIGSASDALNSSNLGSALMQMRNTTDERAKQIAQVAQSENFKIQ